MGLLSPLAWLTLPFQPLLFSLSSFSVCSRSPAGWLFAECQSCFRDVPTALLAAPLSELQLDPKLQAMLVIRWSLFEEAGPPRCRDVNPGLRLSHGAELLHWSLCAVTVSHWHLSERPEPHWSFYVNPEVEFEHRLTLGEVVGSGLLPIPV